MRVVKFLEPFVYRLHISNKTSHDLAVRSRQLAYGIWQTDGEDGNGPAGIPAGATVEALAIRAAADPRKGYEFRCAWGTDESEPPGSLTLFVSVPFTGGRNRAGLDVSGPIRVQGWTGVSTIGHRFEHTLTITSIPW